MGLPCTIKLIHAFEVKYEYQKSTILIITLLCLKAKRFIEAVAMF